MFIKLFKSGYSLQLIVLFVVAILLWVPSFIHPLSASHELSPAPFYNYVYYFLRKLPFLQIIIAFLLIILEAFLLNKILINNGVIRKNTFMTAFVYIILMSQNPELHTLYPALLSNFLLIIAFYYILKLYNETEAYAQVFNAGFLIGIASLFYLPAIFFIFIMWIGLIIFSIFLWREWLISLIGLLIPYFFLFVFYFWFDRLEDMIDNYFDFFRNIREFCFNLNVYQLIILSIIALFVLLAINRILTLLNKKTISLRKKSIIMIWFFLISLITVVYASDTGIKYLALTFVPTASLIAYYFGDIRKKLVIEIIFIVMMILIFMLRAFYHA